MKIELSIVPVLKLRIETEEYIYEEYEEAWASSIVTGIPVKCKRCGEQFNTPSFKITPRVCVSCRPGKHNRYTQQQRRLKGVTRCGLCKKDFPSDSGKYGVCSPCLPLLYSEATYEQYESSWLNRAWVVLPLPTYNNGGGRIPSRPSINKSQLRDRCWSRKTLEKLQSTRCLTQKVSQNYVHTGLSRSAVWKCLTPQIHAKSHTWEGQKLESVRLAEMPCVMAVSYSIAPFGGEQNSNYEPLRWWTIERAQYIYPTWIRG